MSMRTRFSTLALLGALFLAGAGLAGCGAEAVPDFVSYSRQIQPLMEARCVRCHGAGGTLNADSDILPNVNKYSGAPTNGYFNRLEDDGMKFGLMHYTGGLVAFTMGYVDGGPMPLPPAAPLSDREHELFSNWLSNPYP
jgi:hypothetical protein